MEMQFRLATREEKLYCYNNSQQISAQAGFIGHLRGDFGSSGNLFFSTFFDFNPAHKSEVFIEALDIIVNELRTNTEYGAVLKDRFTMRDYCSKCRVQINAPYRRDHVCFRIDVEGYTYMLRCIPDRGDYNFYLYCYWKKRLDAHMEKAKRGIKILRSRYKEIFRIADGDKVRLYSDNDEYQDICVRYVDDCHIDIGAGWDERIIHIFDFAEKLRSGRYRKISPIRTSLPKKLYTINPNTGDVVCVEQGKMNYQLAEFVNTENALSVKERFNDSLGVTKAQEAAMVAGATVGWASPLADPANYEDDGSPRPCIAQLHSDREAEAYPDIHWEVQTLNDRDEVLTVNTFDGEDENEAWEFYHRLTGPKAFIKVDADGEPIEELAYIKE